MTDTTTADAPGRTARVGSPAGPPGKATAHGNPADQRLLRRLERRELHRSRSFSASTALIVTALAIAAPGALIIANRQGLSVPGVTVAGQEGIAPLADPSSPINAGLGALLAVVGVVWLCLGLSRARRARRALERDGVVVIVEDRVVASAISRAAARAARSTPDHARTSIGGGRAHVTLRSQAGYKLDDAAARDSVGKLVRALRPKRPLQITLKEEPA